MTVFRFVTRLALSAVAAAIFVSPLILTTSTHADSPTESITLSPVEKVYTVSPGQVVNDSLLVLNDGSTPYTFTVYATPYSVINEAYTPSFTITKPNADAYTWIQFQQTTYHANPHETITIPYTIHVSDHATPGGHYGAIFAEVQPSSSSDSSSLVVKKRVGTIVYATVKGDVTYAGQTSSITTSWLQTHPPLTSQVYVKNTGNSDFPASISYKVSDIFGGVKYSFQNSYEVLPQTTRDISLQWSKSAWFGLYKVAVSSTVLGHTTSASSYVLMMPVWLMLLLAIVIVGGGTYAIIAGRRARKKDAE